MTDNAEPSLVILARHPDGSVDELPAERIDEIDRLTDRDGTLVWVSAVAPSDADIEALGREFRLHPLALEDLRKQHQRPKLDTYEQQHMIVAHEEVADAPDGLSEIHIFVGAGWLLSVTWTSTPMCDAVRQGFAGRRNSRTDTTGELLYALLDAESQGLVLGRRRHAACIGQTHDHPAATRRRDATPDADRHAGRDADRHADR
jgi:magnesium transporter